MGSDKKVIMLHPDFAIILGRYNIGMNEMAKKAGIARPTLYSLQNPSIHPWRKGGMRPITAWKIVNAFSQETGITPEESWKLLLVEDLQPRVKINTKAQKPEPAAE